MEIFRLVFNPIEVNTYILADADGKCTVIDCGCYTLMEFGEFTGFLDKHKLEPVLLLNTHCHLDHIFGNKLFREKYGLGPRFHKDDEVNRKDSVQHAMLFGLVMDLPPEPEAYIADGQIITFGNVELKALHVPGHAPGSLCFWSEKDGAVFTGDALFAGSIGRSDLTGGNHELLVRSIRAKLFTLPPETVVYPGHGESTTIEREIKFNPYFN
jgi:glyoxylase-like metal-dependent hydrolase (beta-lactamase superfamily II)